MLCRVSFRIGDSTHTTRSEVIFKAALLAKLVGYAVGRIQAAAFMGPPRRGSSPGFSGRDEE
jgi:hypothetical protein